jgi:lipoprotein-anchoring transpeptidase ErfK/SrfK
MYRQPIARHAKPKPKHHMRQFILLLFVVVVAVGLGHWWLSSSTTKTVAHTAAVTQTKAVTKTVATSSTAKAAPAPNACASNTLSQNVIVSISQRQLWACEGTKQVYNSFVITGMEFLPADLTPTGTYQIFAKERDHTLTGCDSTGCWNDYVSYYMIFLTNQYGNYGFHDATWRTADQFGNISPNSTQASHGCVECPLATAEWLYNWSVIGTTVTIQA